GTNQCEQGVVPLIRSEADKGESFGRGSARGAGSGDPYQGTQHWGDITVTGGAFDGTGQIQRRPQQVGDTRGDRCVEEFQPVLGGQRSGQSHAPIAVQVGLAEFHGHLTACLPHTPGNGGGGQACDPPSFSQGIQV